MKIRTDLPEPKIEFVRTKIGEFNRDNEDVERGLKQLIGAFPKNSDLGHVLVKVAAINVLYRTLIFGVFEVAKVIKDAAIDPLLESGDPKVVEKITKVTYTGKTRWNYSFATKYCSWHRAEMYPIFDSRVDFCLRSYRAMYPFAKFTQNDLWDYEQFKKIVTAFRDHYGLGSLTYKEIDKFLYQLGNEYFTSAEPGSGQIGVQTTSVVPTEVVLEVGSEVGSEGGSITLLRENSGDGWRFRVKTDETAAYEMLSEEDQEDIEFQTASRAVGSFEEALEQLDRYPWTRLIPLKVHPEFLQQILAAVEKRDGKEIAVQWNERLTH